MSGAGRARRGGSGLAAAWRYLPFVREAWRVRRDPRYRVPLTLNLQITHRCPNDCAYCDYDRTLPDAFDLPILRRLLGEYRAQGGRRVSLTGGDPLVQPELAAVVAEARRLGLWVSISTSGVGAAEQVDALRRADMVMLSFDGPGPVREALTGPVAARAAEDAAALFRREGIPFWTTTVLARPVLPHLEWIVAHAARAGSVANFVLLHTQPGQGRRFHPRAEDVAPLMPSRAELRAALRRLIRLKIGGGPVGSSLPYLETLLAWPDPHVVTSPEPGSVPCLAGRVSAEITADGRLYACGWERGRVAGVDVRDGGFARAWARLPLPRACASCATSCWLESNLIFGLDPRALANWARFLLRG